MDTENFSLLTFCSIDLSKDINIINRFMEVLVTEDVAYRQYINSNDIYRGVVFGDGKSLNIFKKYGFRISSDMFYGEDCVSFYTYNIDSILNTSCSDKSKKEILTIYLKYIFRSDYKLIEDELDLYLDWLISLVKGCNTIIDYKLEYNNYTMSYVEFKESKNVNYFKNLPIEFNTLNKEIERDDKYSTSYVYSGSISLVNYSLAFQGIPILSKEATELLLSLNKQELNLRNLVTSRYNQDGDFCGIRVE